MLTAGNVVTRVISKNFLLGEVLNTHKGTECSCIWFQKPLIFYHSCFISSPPFLLKYFKRNPRDFVISSLSNSVNSSKEDVVYL